MSPHRSPNKEQTYSYEIKVTDWSAYMSFNEYAYYSFLDGEPFKEQLSIEMAGTISSTSSKKVQLGQRSKIILHPSDGWYDVKKINDKQYIGNIDVKKLYDEDEPSLIFNVGVPTKSYENIRAYLTYKSEGTAFLAGTDLHYRKGKIIYVSFDK